MARQASLTHPSEGVHADEVNSYKITISYNLGIVVRIPRETILDRKLTGLCGKQPQTLKYRTGTVLCGPKQKIKSKEKPGRFKRVCRTPYQLSCCTNRRESVLKEVEIVPKLARISLPFALEHKPRRLENEACSHVLKDTQLRAISFAVVFVKLYTHINKNARVTTLMVSRALSERENRSNGRQCLVCIKFRSDSQDLRSTVRFKHYDASCKFCTRFFSKLLRSSVEVFFRHYGQIFVTAIYQPNFYRLVTTLDNSSKFLVNTSSPFLQQFDFIHMRDFLYYYSNTLLSNHYKCVLLTMYILIFILGTFVNIVLVHTIRRLRNPKSLTNRRMLLFRVICDLGLVWFVVPHTAYTAVYHNWQLGTIICKLSAFTMYFFVALNNLILVAICLNRAVAISESGKSPTVPTINVPCRVKCLISVAISVAFLIAFSGCFTKKETKYPLPAPIAAAIEKNPHLRGSHPKVCQ
ncbi:hypothetical protein CSKR_110531 [Clonorchis sinensis]|uniref:G-protein coupled receptors family 1 profile domain-containing protein n=1 Tax=Clonorchis sinensis TaxID=79923 RepID=A0A3R7CXD2_CLOSI|nr:hypothetical protein CSKR_110531 [Clonorchis sinensis]